MGRPTEWRRELDFPAYIGMRNWNPFIADTVKQMTEDGVSGPWRSAWRRRIRAPALDCTSKCCLATGAPFAIDFVEEWHDHPLLIGLSPKSYAAGWKRCVRRAGAKLPVIFTAHSVPQRTIAEGDPYETQTRETAALVAARGARRSANGVRLPEPGHVGRRMAGSHSGRHDFGLKEDRAQRRVPPAHRLSLRPRGNAVRHRYWVPGVCRGARHATVARRVAERFACAAGRSGGRRIVGGSASTAIGRESRELESRFQAGYSEIAASSLARPLHAQRCQ